MALSDQDILDFVGENPGAGRDAIRKGVARDVSETTVWRLLKRMVAVSYTHLTLPTTLRVYVSVDPLPPANKHTIHNPARTQLQA